jgi:hypothetical protein
VPVATTPLKAEFQPFPAEFMQKCEPLPKLANGVTEGQIRADAVLDDETVC